MKTLEIVWKDESITTEKCFSWLVKKSTVLLFDEMEFEQIMLINLSAIRSVKEIKR